MRPTGAKHQDEATLGKDPEVKNNRVLSELYKEEEEKALLSRQMTCA